MKDNSHTDLTTSHAQFLGKGSQYMIDKLRVAGVMKHKLRAKRSVYFS